MFAVVAAQLKRVVDEIVEVMKMRNDALCHVMCTSTTVARVIIIIIIIVIIIIIIITTSSSRSSKDS